MNVDHSRLRVVGPRVHWTRPLGVVRLVFWGSMFTVFGNWRSCRCRIVSCWVLGAGQFVLFVGPSQRVLEFTGGVPVSLQPTSGSSVVSDAG